MAYTDRNPNTATEEKQDAIISALNNSGGDVAEWKPAYGIDKEDATYYYFGSSKVGATDWRIQRLTKADLAVAWASGTSDGATNYADRDSLTYVSEL